MVPLACSSSSGTTPRTGASSTKISTGLIEGHGDAEGNPRTQAGAVGLATEVEGRTHAGVDIQRHGGCLKLHGSLRVTR